jgi:hypothetical protein
MNRQGELYSLQGHPEGGIQIHGTAPVKLVSTSRQNRDCSSPFFDALCVLRFNVLDLISVFGLSNVAGHSNVDVLRRCSRRFGAQPDAAAEIAEVAVPAAVGGDEAEIMKQQLFESSPSRP